MRKSKEIKDTNLDQLLKRLDRLVFKFERTRGLTRENYYIRELKKFVLENVPEQGVIIANDRGKYIFPERALIRHQDVPFDELVRVIELLIQDKKKVFLIIDGNKVIGSKLLKIADVSTITDNVDTMHQIIRVKK